MLANYEKRHFSSGESAWVGRYMGLGNILHWHFECEIIYIVSGNAEVIINNATYRALAGDCFFCAGSDIHYINSGAESIIDIIVFNSDIGRKILDLYSLLIPKLTCDYSISKYVELIEYELRKKEPLYNHAVDNYILSLVISIFRGEKILGKFDKKENELEFYKKLIYKINNEFSYITFADAAVFSGYSSAYFSKLFQRISGMSFTQYLNIVKTENAISMLKERKKETSITDISLECGFATVRNFNRVFREITGVTPRSMPFDYVINKELKISKTDDFNPTIATSKLI